MTSASYGINPADITPKPLDAGFEDVPPDLVTDAMRNDMVTLINACVGSTVPSMHAIPPDGCNYRDYFNAVRYGYVARIPYLAVFIVVCIHRDVDLTDSGPLHTLAIDHVRRVLSGADTSLESLVNDPMFRPITMHAASAHPEMTKLVDGVMRQLTVWHWNLYFDENALSYIILPQKIPTQTIRLPDSSNVDLPNSSTPETPVDLPRHTETGGE